MLFQYRNEFFPCSEKEYVIFKGVPPVSGAHHFNNVIKEVVKY